MLNAKPPQLNPLAILSTRVHVPSLLPRPKANSPLKGIPHGDDLSTASLKPTFNSFNSHKLNQGGLSPLTAQFTKAASRQIIKKPATSHTPSNTVFYDEYIDAQHIVARYEIAETCDSKLTSSSPASTRLEIFQDSISLLLAIIRDFFLCLWSIISRNFHTVFSLKHRQILPIHHVTSLPQVFKMVMPISGYDLEIEGRVAHSEKLHNILYQIYCRPDYSENEIKGDIVYLPETPLNGPMDVSPLMAAFIHAGHRIIIPQVDGRGNLSKSAVQSVLNVGHQSRVIATVLRHLRYSDIELEKRHQPGNFSIRVSPSGRPIFLLGLGHTALVALSYPLEIGQPVHQFLQSTGSSGALSIPSVSLRAEPARSLMGKLTSFCGTSKQGRAEFKRCGPLPNIQGIIAICPMLDPRARHPRQISWFQRTKMLIDQGVEPVNYSPSMNNAVKNLHRNASNIRVPVMIAHGTKVRRYDFREAFGHIEAVNSFYGGLPSVESTLVFCPTLWHNGDLAAESARNGLANDCMNWMGEKIDCSVPRFATTPDVSTESLHRSRVGIEDVNPSSRASIGVNGTSSLSPEAILTADEDMDEVDYSSDFGTWFGSQNDCDRSDSRNSCGGESIRSFRTQSARFSSGSYLGSPELLGSLSIEIDMDRDSPHVSTSGFSTPAPRTPGTDFFPFLPPSAKIIDHGPRDVVAVLRSNRASFQSLSCVNIPGSSLEFH
ncbi:hypothetical protein VP01_88g3 [Puccinia sorghi]|uniref:Uncharacterized protein n=1 Tax=Puccinia sorghi TaxID=27349 RepID=A0A0L6U872_9BASI|nr:hypothetical protein VP01_88g3 [Puccinia sorghi]